MYNKLYKSPVAPKIEDCLFRSNDMPPFWFYVNVTVTIQTPSEAPVIAPRHVSGGGGKVGTLTITWEVINKTQTTAL